MTRLLLLAFAGCAAAFAQNAVLIRDAQVHTLAGETLERGSVLIENGKIVGVGRRLRAPRAARVIDAEGLHVYPGIFDAYTDLGLAEVSAVGVTRDVSESGDFNPQLDALIAVNPESVHIPVTRSNGVTHVMTAMRGSRIAGRAGVMNLSGWTWEEMAVDPTGPLVVEWPRLRVYEPGSNSGPDRPTTFAAAKKRYDERIGELERWLEAARHYAQAREAAPQTTSADRKLEALVPFLRGDAPVLINANDARSIRDAVSFAEEHELEMILAGGAEADEVVELLAEKGIPVLLNRLEVAVGDEDAAYDRIYSLPGVLQRAGVPFAITSRAHYLSRSLPYEAAAAVPFGLPKEEALKAITAYPAEILGLGDRLGTIEEGKIANLIITDGDPLEIRTQIRHVLINGEAVPLDNEHERLYRKYQQRLE